NHRLLSNLFRNPAIGSPASQPVQHDPIPFRFHSTQKLPYPSIRHPHLLRGFALGYHAVLCSLEPVQPISFLLIHFESFHPSSLAAVKRNFLLCPIRNFSLCRDTLVRFWSDSQELSILP